MPTLTPKLGLKKPLGNETVNRAAYNENLDIMDSAVASQDEVTSHKTAATLDHPDGSVTDAKIGQRTISDTMAPISASGLLGNLLNGIGYILRAITGQANWWTAPAINLETVAQRFWISGCVGGTPGTMHSITGGAAVDVQNIFIALSPSVHLKLKHARFSFGAQSMLRLQVALSPGSTWTSATHGSDELPECDLGTGTIQNPFPALIVRIYNPASTVQNCPASAGWWIELVKE